jgi:hypothetical protein
VRAVSPRYFSLLGIPVSGREFTDADRTDAPHVAIINRAAAAMLYPGENPIGRRLQLATAPDTNSATIVGLANDVRFLGPADDAKPEVFQPAAQSYWATDAIIVRGRESDAGLLAAVRQAVRSIDRSVPLSDVQTMQEVARKFGERQRFYASVFGLFAGAALFLSAIGVYGLVAYSVALRRREVAVRLALGASAASVVRNFLSETAVLVIAGAAIGAACSLAFERFVASLLFQTPSSELSILFAATGLLSVCALVAAAIPATRAGRSPIVSILR